MKMKKNFLIILMSLIFFAAPVFADCEYTDMCAQPTGLSSKASQIASGITGATLLSQTVAQSLIKKELKKATNQKFSVKVKAYSLQDLKNGKFKYLRISGKNLDFDGIYISS